MIIVYYKVGFFLCCRFSAHLGHQTVFQKLFCQEGDIRFFMVEGEVGPDENSGLEIQKHGL